MIQIWPDIVNSLASLSSAVAEDDAYTPMCNILCKEQIGLRVANTANDNTLIFPILL